jgi:hypothetical protein
MKLEEEKYFRQEKQNAYMNGPRSEEIPQILAPEGALYGRIMK